MNMGIIHLWYQSQNSIFPLLTFSCLIISTYTSRQMKVLFRAWNNVRKFVLRAWQQMEICVQQNYSIAWRLELSHYPVRPCDLKWYTRVQPGPVFPQLIFLQDNKWLQRIWQLKIKKWGLALWEKSMHCITDTGVICCALQLPIMSLVV